MPLAGSGVAFVGRSGRAHVSQNLEVAKTFPEDERLSSFGIRAYVRARLFVRERPIGSITVSRLQPRPFQSDEVAPLEDVSRPIALAVANSLACEEVRRLEDQLHAENPMLREEIDRNGTNENS
jgi:formate hydrogenlyase transcriptional activator